MSDVDYESELMSETTNSTAVWAIGHLTYRISGVAGGGQEGTRASGRSPWGRINTLNSAI